jgi:hypothetical protein
MKYNEEKTFGWIKSDFWIILILPAILLAIAFEMGLVLSKSLTLSNQMFFLRYVS